MSILIKKFCIMCNQKKLIKNKICSKCKKKLIDINANIINDIINDINQENKQDYDPKIFTLSFN